MASDWKKYTLANISLSEGWLCCQHLENKLGSCTCPPAVDACSLLGLLRAQHHPAFCYGYLPFFFRGFTELPYIPGFHCDVSQSCPSHASLCEEAQFYNGSGEQPGLGCGHLCGDLHVGPSGLRCVWSLYVVTLPWENNFTC